MKIYVDQDRVILQGKSWQVLHMIKHYEKHFTTVKEWSDAMQQLKR
ncbi:MULTISPECIES: Z-ring formation inhibitor MciZ [unclassified Geomicrobium]|nr:MULTISPECIES: Z-ring formation inhibitor MciZ [unclassified Geomicrobium]